MWNNNPAMDMLLAMNLVGEIAHRGSFAAAAEALHLSPPSVSRIVSELETDLGVRLFNRTTRQIALTEAGERFLRRSSTIVEEIAALREETRAQHGQPRGQLRVSCVNGFGNMLLAPAIPRFLDMYPQVRVDLEISNRLVDLVHEHVDVAIRVGTGKGGVDSSLVARRIFAQKLIFVATPDYIARHGAPQSLDDLAGHRVVKQVTGTWGRVNHLRHGGETVEYSAPDDFVLNSPIAARNAALAGYGLWLGTDYFVAEDLAEGRLVRLLPDYETVDQPILAVYVHRTHVPAKIRVFLDYLAEVFARRRAEQARRAPGPATKPR